MTRDHRKTVGAVLVVLVWGRTGALSMLVSLAARSVWPSSSRAAVPRVAGNQQSHRCSARVVAWAPGSQYHVTWRRERPGCPMSTTSRVVPSASEDLEQSRDSTANASCEDGVTPAAERATTAATAVLGRVVPAEEPWLTEAGARLRSGKLVAFPTETVYGLGANALSEDAVLKIFEAKQRPLTDPLIVHVPDTAGALAVVDFEVEGSGGQKARRLLDLLGEKLWPGPLTLIAKADKKLPPCITAGTGFVGVRCPAHPVTRQLLSIAGVPVAAPSANRFGHVSPTQAVHVMEDLGGSDILVLDGDTSGACGVGIESTVAKIDAANDRILILRMGGVTQDRIRDALKEGGEEFSGISVYAGSVAGGQTDAKGEEEREREAQASLEDEPAKDEGQAPGFVRLQCAISDAITGQLLRHYSPDLEVFRVLGATPGSTSGRMVGGGEHADLASMARTSVVIDFAGQLKGLQASAVAYSDLSSEGSADEAAKGLFRALRWAERQPSAQRLLIAGLPSASNGDMAAAVNDRIYRSASGKTISVE
ncbi:unnamed protein product [Ectocarpus sp. 12 AP-2014]